MSEALTAADVMDALRKRWPESEYVHVPEAPQDSGRQGRKIDLLVISMWASRGHERDAVEIKVSLSDLRREIKNPGKADWWWQHAHRFWVAVPSDIADKAKEELPTGWGLLSVRRNGDATVAHAKVKPAVNHDCSALPQQTVVGIIRAAENAGPSAIMRAENDGYNRGLEAGRKSAQGSGSRSELEQRLRDQDRMLTELTGRSLREWHGDWGRDLADVIKLLTEWGKRPDDIARRFDNAIRDAQAAAQNLEAIRDAAAAALNGKALAS